MKKLREMREEEGFTLIELLVVIVIIGILAAIAIPTFLSSRQNAWESAMESDLRNAATAMELYLNESGSYAAADNAGLVANGYNPTANVTDTAGGAGGVEVVEATADTYCLGAGHANLPGTLFYLGSEPGETSVSDVACN